MAGGKAGGTEVNTEKFDVNNPKPDTESASLRQMLMTTNLFSTQ